MTAIQTIAQTSGRATGPPSMSARVASTTCVIGFTFTKPRSHPGIEPGGANTELAKVRGRMIRNPPVLTDSGVRADTPMKAIGQDTAGDDRKPGDRQRPEPVDEASLEVDVQPQRGLEAGECDALDQDAGQ